MSKNQEQMKKLINDVRAGKADKELFCKEIQKEVNSLIYPVFGEDYKKISPRAIIDICTNLDSIDVDKNIMRQIATRVSVFMFGLIDNSTIKIDDDYEYEYSRIKEDKELFDIVKANSRIFKDFRAYDTASDNIKSLSRVQTIMMELYGYEMHSVDEIETLLDVDSAFISKLIAMMKDNILGRSSAEDNMSAYAEFDEDDTEDTDIKIYGAEQKEQEAEASGEEDVYEPENVYESENADSAANESEEDMENDDSDDDDSDDEDSDEGVSFEYDMTGYENNEYDDAPVRGVSLMDKLTAFVGRVFPGVPRARRRNVVYASMVVILVVIILIVSIAAMAGGNRRKVNNKNNSNDWTPMEYTTKAPKETATSKESQTAAQSSGTAATTAAESTSGREETTAANERTTAENNNRRTTEAANGQEEVTEETEQKENRPSSDDDDKPEETKPEETTASEETTPAENTTEETTTEAVTEETTEAATEPVSDEDNSSADN